MQRASILPEFIVRIIIMKSIDRTTVYHRSNEGSAIITALIFTMIISLLAATFMGYAMHESKMASRLHDNTSLFYSAEGGLDLAAWALNNSNWSGWKSYGGDKYTSSSFTDGKNNRTHTVQVLVQKYATLPTVYSQASVTLADGSTKSRQLRMTFDVSGGSGAGMVSKSYLDFSGQVDFWAYDSSFGPPDFNSNRSDQVIIGTISQSSDSFKISGQIDLYGYAGTGKNKPDISNPDQTRIYGENTPNRVNIDWSRVSQDFTFDFPAVEQPSWSGAKKSLPSEKKKKITLGNASGAVTKYKVDKLDISGDTYVDVIGPVQMYLSDGMSVSGGSYIKISNGGSLEVYTPKDVTISGDGKVSPVENKTGLPSNARFYGTVNKEKDQSFTISGDGAMTAVVYAPNAVVQYSGNGQLNGSVVGYEIKMSGQATFCYDTQLGEGGKKIEGISSWYELRGPSERLNIAAYLGNSAGKGN